MTVALQGVDEGVGVHVAPARHVHQPGPLVHGLELGSPDDVAGLGGECQGQHHQPGLGEGLVQSLGGEGAQRPGHRLRGAGARR